MGPSFGTKASRMGEVELTNNSHIKIRQEIPLITLYEMQHLIAQCLDLGEGGGIGDVERKGFGHGGAAANVGDELDVGEMSMIGDEGKRWVGLLTWPLRELWGAWTEVLFLSSKMVLRSLKEVEVSEPLIFRPVRIGCILDLLNGVRITTTQNPIRIFLSIVEYCITYPTMILSPTSYGCLMNKKIMLVKTSERLLPINQLRPS